MESQPAEERNRWNEIVYSQGYIVGEKQIISSKITKLIGFLEMCI
jgi:hypothetical protein